MPKNNWQAFEFVFKNTCLFITLGLITFWSYKFLLNEDLSIVEYKEYDNEKNGNPYLAQALCFRNPFVSSDGTHLNASQETCF